MKTVGFIGAYDKTDLITYIAKILVTMGKSVLVIDATTLQKAKYVVPTISPAKSYVTEYEDMDIAVGFYNYASIKEYLGMPQHAVFTYDYIFLDIDSPESLENFDIKTANKNYFVSGFDVYSLKRGLEILSGIKEPMPLTKVFFSKNITQEEDEYFDYIALGYKVIWDEERVYFPFEQGDQTIIMENQRVSKIKFRKLTQLYRESLLYIAEEILDNPKETGEIRKAFKKLEKGV
jgi:hypothetical protein